MILWLLCFAGAMVPLAVALQFAVRIHNRLLHAKDGDDEFVDELSFRGAWVLVAIFSIATVLLGFSVESVARAGEGSQLTPWSVAAGTWWIRAPIRVLVQTFCFHWLLGIRFLRSYLMAIIYESVMLVLFGAIFAAVYVLNPGDASRQAALQSAGSDAKPGSLTPSSGTTMDRVRRIVSRQMNVPMENITPSTSLEHLGADDLDLIELIMEFEDSFSITIPDDALELDGNRWQRLTIEKLSELVDRQVKTGASNAAAADASADGP